MFTINKKLQYPVQVDRPDPVYARQLQELLGGKYGEMTVMIQYLFQGWGMRGDAGDARLIRVKDLLLETGAEEIAHVEMLATCISLLLDGASPEQQEEAAKNNPAVEAALGGGMNPQHLIASGLSAMPVDSNGNPWNGAYATASNNIVADLYANAVAEMQGRLQACRMYEMTTDTGIRNMLSFMIARDHMHQMQWLAAIEEFGKLSDVIPVPVDFPLSKEQGEYAFTFMGYAQQPEQSKSGQGTWAKGRSLDGRGSFKYVAEPFAVGQVPSLLEKPDPTLHSEPPKERS
jgi:Mn-containing catalase